MWLLLCLFLSPPFIPTTGEIINRKPKPHWTLNEASKYVGRSRVPLERVNMTVEPHQTPNRELRMQQIPDQSPDDSQCTKVKVPLTSNKNAHI